MMNIKKFYNKTNELNLRLNPIYAIGYSVISCVSAVAEVKKEMMKKMEEANYVELDQ